MYVYFMCHEIRLYYQQYYVLISACNIRSFSYAEERLNALKMFGKCTVRKGILESKLVTDQILYRGTRLFVDLNEDFNFHKQKEMD